MHNNVISLLIDAANLMIIGMFVVFLFLTALIGAVNFIAWINKMFPDAEMKLELLTVNSTNSNSVISPRVIAAISSAIYQHRAKK
jgi:oxaloacetate decarboxylase (Na+ extruding) subunit gamma